MKRQSILMLLVAACVMAMANIASADTFGTGSNQFIIDFVTISGDTNPTSGYSIVNNDYRMGTYEITNDQWNKYINIYGTPTGSPTSAYDQNPQWSGTNVPTTALSWYEAAQFVNWLNTSSGYQAGYKFTGTQGQSDYTFVPWEYSDVGYDADNPFRNSNAFYFLPTEDEWIKAAYWNGTSLQTYATKPGDILYQGNGSNGGWNYRDGGYVDPYGPWDVGSGSEELNGTFDMMGNVLEWMESPYYSGDYLSDSDRGIRGGCWWMYDSHFSLSGRSFDWPQSESGAIGFRVASVPVPGAVILGTIGLSFSGWLCRRRRL